MNIKSEIKTFNFDAGLKVGVISDSQLSPFSKSKESTFKNNLVVSLKELRNQGCNMIIFAGDIGNLSSRFALKTYKDTMDSIFSNSSVLTQTIMGNHDYYSLFRTPEMCRSLFQNVFSESPYTHYVVNGYHFIGASPDCHSMTDGYSKMLPWLKEQIDIAVNDSKTKPVFVTTHNSAHNTVYGSNDWGDKGLNGLFKNYPNLVSISGHLHYSLLDERSFYKKDYTAIGTQSVSYTEMEKGKANGSVPPNAYKTPMGYILDFCEKNIAIKRMNFKNGTEEKTVSRWNIPKHITKEYFENTNREISTPSMPKTTGSFEYTGESTVLCFDAGIDSDLVHSYKLVFSDGTEQLYFSDFYNGTSDMKKKVNLPIYSKASGVYNIKVFAINSYGKTSKNFTSIDNVKIKKEEKYKRKFAPEIIY